MKPESVICEGKRVGAGKEQALTLAPLCRWICKIGESCLARLCVGSTRAVSGSAVRASHTFKARHTLAPKHVSV